MGRMIDHLNGKPLIELNVIDLFGLLLLLDKFIEGELPNSSV